MGVETFPCIHPQRVAWTLGGCYTNFAMHATSVQEKSFSKCMVGYFNYLITCDLCTELISNPKGFQSTIWWLKHSGKWFTNTETSPNT
jgi:hypothetical protein